MKFPFEGRYFTAGDATSAKQIWFVLHGYGQLASFFIRKFDNLAQRGIFVVAPEALSRFYIEETESRMRSGNNRVGASWMTREDRLRDISNYLRYLDAVYNAVVGQEETSVTILGFSQGAATATRWALEGKVKFERLILWAGIFPPDVDLHAGREILKGKKTCLVYGDKDPFINDSRFAEMGTMSEKLGVSPAIIKFDGGHAIDANTLLQFI